MADGDLLHLALNANVWGWNVAYTGTKLTDRGMRALAMLVAQHGCLEELNLTGEKASGMRHAHAM